MFLRSLCLLSVYAGLVLLSRPLFAQMPEETPNQQLLKTDLLVVTAHPDDESMMAATMAHYADLGKTVSLVTCTRGEGGGNGTGKELGEALGQVREAELRRCLSLLGTKYLYFLNQADWAYTESVQATLDKWGKEITFRRLVRLVRMLRPEVICTMDPTPVGGQHGHHQAAGRLATEAFAAAADPRVFPDQIEEEGLRVWQVKKLYWVSFMGGALLIKTDGVASGALATQHPGKRYADIAALAESNHRSQGFDKFFSSMPPGQNFFARPNGFTLIKSCVPTTPKSEQDLFDGIAGTTPLKNDILPHAPATTPAPLEVRFQPLPALRNFHQWLMENGLPDRIAYEVPRQSITSGTLSYVYVTFANHTQEEKRVRVSLVLPPGWRSNPAEKDIQATPNTSTVYGFMVASPAGLAQTSQEVSLKVDGVVQEASKGKLEVFPETYAAALKAVLPVDADIAKWERLGVKSVAIPHTHSAQGGVRDDKEISGRFFVGHSESALHVLVDVTDDTVVRNIAPDDIKGHWRTTSTEICIDPKPRGENTFGTLKLGIFPQDITGRVRAGRDADANPGPVDRKEPSIQLASRLTPTGYVVEALIPWTTLKIKRAEIKRGTRFGFNVILFHAGKKEARVGEDIGKSRLAWSYGSGVWGRPEIWGTLVLK